MNATGLGSSPTGELESKPTKVKAWVLSIKGVTTITCQSIVTEKVVLSGTNQLKGVLKFDECSATAPCKTRTTITTKALKGEAQAGVTPEVIIAITPAVGTVLANIELEGESCALAGTQPAVGKVTVKVPDGQEEKTKHLVEVKSTGELTVGGSASLEGAAEVGLTDGSKWSWK
jgi:hypothetical protein